MLSGRRKRDYATEAAAGSLEAQAARYGIEPATAEAAEADEPAVPADEPMTEDEGVLVG